METDWRNLYGESWKGLITDEAFAHPAKFSRALIRKIYTHLIEDGFLKPGDTVLDPFGGVALGGHDAMRLGLHWVGCELEAKFHALGNGNIDLWRERYTWFPGTATLLNGDSRNLAQVVGAGINGTVSSPPYAGTDPSASHVQGFSRLDPNSPNFRPFAVKSIQDGYNDTREYGSTPGQLGGMKEGDFSAVVTSPPYDQARIDGQGDEGSSGLRNADGSFVRGAAGWELRKAQGGRYGDTDGNLANLPSGDFGAAVSSPPFEDSLHTKPRDDEYQRNRMVARGRNPDSPASGLGEYGDSDGQIGNTSGDSFWLAARQIVEQVYLLLAPGAPAVWVVKDYVRNKQIVPFCDQWRQLCEAVGFETLHIHRAWLVEERGTQLDLMGNAHTKTVERKSFFRRLAEKKGSPRIDWETVICMQKPK